MRIQRFSLKQRRVLLWWSPASPDSRYEAVICDGAVRSGKTLAMGLSFLCWAMTSFDNEQFALCGKTIGALRRNVLAQVLPLAEQLGLACTQRRSDNQLVIRGEGHENTFYLVGGKDEGSAALIQGATFAGVLLDEVALMPRSFVEQALARCSVEDSRIWFNCNPEGPFHWFYREWICRSEERGALYLHFTMEDNPGLSPAMRQRYENRYSGAFYRRFVLGEWSAAQGLIYDFFQPETDVRPAPESGLGRWCISVDYGTANPCSFGLWGEKDGVWYRVKEYYYASRETGRQKTDQEYVEDLRRLAGGRTIEQIVVDPSAASFIAALRQEGYRVVKADNDVLSGIRLTAGLLKSGKMVICSGCEDCLRELSCYCWEEGDGREVPRKENDHAMDEMRYFAATVAGRTGGGGFAATAVER